MKYLILIAVMFLISCGYGYEVRTNYKIVTQEQKQAIYTCTNIKPIFFFDVNEAICETKEECNKICNELRSKK